MRISAIRFRAVVLAVATLVPLSGTLAQAPAPVASSSTGDSVLHPSDLEPLLPQSVFFKGQTAPLQSRNSGGIHFKDGTYMFASLVDTSGYSSGVQEKYQAYLITEDTLLFGSHSLAPGAYGVGFIQGPSFLIMDIGGRDLFTVPAAKDEALKRPTPLHVDRVGSSGKFRLYAGRLFVEYSRVPAQP